MRSVLTENRTESIANVLRQTLRASMKEAFVEALEEVEAERSRRSRTRRIASAMGLLGIGATLGYRLRQQGLPDAAVEELAETAPEIAEEIEQVGETGRVGTDRTGAGRDGGGRSTASKLAAVGAVVGLAWAVRRWRGSRGRQTDVTEYASERTEDVTEEAADRVEAGGRTAADRMEEAGDAAEDVREQTKESIEDRSSGE